MGGFFVVYICAVKSKNMGGKLPALLSLMPQLIKLSALELSSIARQMNMSSTLFETRMSANDWTHEEMETLIRIIDCEAIEDCLFTEVLKATPKTKSISAVEFRNSIQDI